jgi:hypothetical protein
MIDWRNFSERLEEIKGFGNIPKLTDAEKIYKIFSLYKNVFGKPFKISCNSCFADAFMELRKITEQQLTDMNNLQFTIKKSVILYHPEKRIYNTTNHKLTNEKALWYLCLNPYLIVKFEKFPADWKTQIEGKKCGEFPEIIDINPVKIIYPEPEIDIDESI